MTWPGATAARSRSRRASPGIAGLVCFYNEKVDIEVDGVLMPRPVTKFSTKSAR